MNYVSQCRQDQVLCEIIFPGKIGGRFLDIGANDGITYSNTYCMEKSLGWTGICVEPLPDTFAKLSSCRNCILENCAVGSSTGVEVFLQITGYAEMLSGLKKNYDTRHLTRIDSEIAMYGGAKKEIELRTVNINDLLGRHSFY